MESAFSTFPRNLEIDTGVGRADRTQTLSFELVRHQKCTHWTKQH